MPRVQTTNYFEPIYLWCYKQEEIPTATSIGNVRHYIEQFVDNIDCLVIPLMRL
jgi:hypothetical protein